MPRIPTDHCVFAQSASASAIASVNIVGQVVGCSDFEETALLCQWRLVAGAAHWSVVAGDTEGQTHVIKKEAGEFGVWCHPIDVHYSCSSIEGWPQLAVEVWQQDEHGRNDICECTRGKWTATRCVCGIAAVVCVVECGAACMVLLHT